MKKIYVADIRERDWYEGALLVRDKVMAMAKNGKPYLTLKLMDRTGELEGRVWDRVDEFADRFDKDDFVQVQGKASVYLGKMQLVIQDLVRLPAEEVDLADFIPVAKRSAEAMEGDLRDKVASLRDPHLKALLEAFLADADFLSRYCTAPAAKAMHHFSLGGLLEPPLAVADLADDICRRYPDINRDLLVTGALLHDIGKLAIPDAILRKPGPLTEQERELMNRHVELGVELLEQIPSFDASPEIVAHQCAQIEGGGGRDQRSRRGGHSGAGEPAREQVAVAVADGEGGIDRYRTRALGFRQFRVRHHDNLVRLEISPEELPRALTPEMASKFVAIFKPLGFNFVTLDLEGYRSGSLNTPLVKIAG